MTLYPQASTALRAGKAAPGLGPPAEIDLTDIPNADARAPIHCVVEERCDHGAWHEIGRHELAQLGRSVNRLNLGCGNDIQAGWVNLDIANLGGVDIIHDLDVAPWPLDDDYFGLIRAYDIFEHAADPVLFMTECHRVLVSGGALHIRSPHFRAIEAFIDPTHRRFCTPYTWDFWIPGTKLHAERNAAYGGVSFRRADLHQDGAAIDLTLEKIP